MPTDHGSRKPPASPPGDVTQLLQAWSQGDAKALEELIPLVYDELHRLAERHLAHERADHTLQPTAVVHEAYLRLVDQKRVTWIGGLRLSGAGRQEPGEREGSRTVSPAK